MPNYFVILQGHASAVEALENAERDLNIAV
jgi:hypothetical protein